MKRRPIDGSDVGDPPISDADEETSSKKKPRAGDEGSPSESPPPATVEKDADVEAEEVAAAELGEDLVFEVLKRADARTLAAAACVCRRWRRLAEDERLWEAVCVRHWANIGCGGQQLRAVVLALGGFRRLHSLYLLPLLHPSLRRTAPAPLPPLPLPSTAGPPPPSTAGAPPHAATPRRPHFPARWGKDEVQLSLSLLSIGFFEKMNHNYKHRGGEGGCG